MSYQLIAPYSGHSSTESTPSPPTQPRGLPLTSNMSVPTSGKKAPQRTIPPPPHNMLQVQPAPSSRHLHSNSLPAVARPPSQNFHQPSQSQHMGGRTEFLPSLPMADLFAPHSDGRHCVCRVCKAMLSGTASAQRGHLMVFHRAGNV